jgi:hypothetical protein
MFGKRTMDLKSTDKQGSITPNVQVVSASLKLLLEQRLLSQVNKRNFEQ